jgi:hypothetical protein
MSGPVLNQIVQKNAIENLTVASKTKKKIILNVNEM